MGFTKATGDYIDQATLTEISAGIDWQTTPKTSAFTAVSGEGYLVDTTSAAITVTLPTSPAIGDEIAILDYVGNANTNNIDITSSDNINGSSNDVKINYTRGGVSIIYTGSAQGWVSFSATNETATALADVPTTVSIEYLLIAGGGGGGHSSNGGGGGAGGYVYGTNTLSNTITISIGGGGTPVDGSNSGSGTNSSISGDFSVSSIGGGGQQSGSAQTGGSGAGGSSSTSGASGTSGQGNSGGSGTVIGGNVWYQDGAGGGAGAPGANASSTGGVGAYGGSGLNTHSTWATATSTGDGGYYAGGGGALGWHRNGTNDASDWNISTGAGGIGGGGDAVAYAVTGINGNASANTGGGGGNGNSNSTPKTSGQGGSGICIIRYPGNQRATGGTVVSSGGYTYHTFTGAGTLVL